MIKIYCDNGACPEELKTLQKEDIVELYMFRYENKNRHIKNSGKPSAALWNDMKNYTWNDVPGTWNDYKPSEKHQEIVDIVGLENKRVDILHLDSAYKSKVDAFVTNDKDDILAYRKELENTLGIKIFHVSEVEDILNYISNANKKQHRTP